MSETVQYITPRLGIIVISPTVSLEEVLSHLKSVHSKYFHIFNLTTLNLNNFLPLHFIPHTNFKWRDIPYSLTEAIKLLTSIQSFLRPNIANSAFFLVPSEESCRFCFFVLQAYAQILNTNRIAICNQTHLLLEFAKLYQSIQIISPPVKIIEAIEFENPGQNFIPIFEIYTETRHNNFQKAYYHEIEEELTQYYINHQRPLELGIGSKFCDQRPETKHLKTPVLVAGDVKIVFYSYDSLKLEKKFVCGFNTKALEFDQTVITLSAVDKYENLSKSQCSVNIYIAEYCENCKERASCPECLEVTKKIVPRYSQSQIDLEKLNRKRSKEQIKLLLG